MPDQSQNARKLAEVYLDQPIKLPDPVRARIEAALGGPVLLYALADLDASLNLARTWVALGEKAVALCAEEGGPDPRLVPRASVAEVRERASLACTSLHLVGADGEALASWRFTHRQRRGMANLQFILGDDAKARNAAGGEAPRAPLPAPDPAKADASYFESLLAPVRKAQALVVPNQMAVVWRLLGYIKPYRWPVAAGMVAAALLALVGLAPPYLTGDLIKLFDGGALDPAVAPEAERLLWLITGSLAAALVFLWIRLHSLAILGEYVARDLRRDVYDRIQSLSVGYFSQHQTGSIISRVNSDTDRIWEFIAFGVVEVSLSLLRLAAMSAVLIALDYRLGLAMVLPLPILLWGIVANGQTMQKLFTAAWRKWSDLNDVVAGTIPGIRVVKAFNQEDHERKRFGGRNAEMTETFNAVHRNWTKFWPALMLGVHAITVGVYWLALPRLFGDGPAPLDLGTFVAFLLYMGMFWQPIEVFGQMARMLNRSLSSARRVFELIDTEPEMLERRDAAKLDPMRGAIEFEGVTFGYDPLRPVLRGISFKAEPGEMIGLAGPSGAGKTTLVNLIARFYDPAEGKIRADGIDLRDLDVGPTGGRSAWSSKIRFSSTARSWTTSATACRRRISTT
ncbi:MAG: ABC transporter transmembrane domain-containing protein [Verrucomicrobiales bacterium]